MQKCVAVLLSLLLLPAAPPSARADAYHAKPKLVVILVIDQFRGDYLDRCRDALKAPKGFNLFTDGMISSVEDERYRVVGTFDDLPSLLPPPAPKPDDPRIGSSPINLKATTIGDEVRLATQGRAKLYGVSLKDQAAILPSGQTANGAFWIDNASGRFVTSTYYMAKLPDWATAHTEGVATL